MRNLTICRWFAPLAWSAILASAAAPAAREARADDPRPAKKDSRAGARPKQARFTTSVSPGRARPGETVTYRVTAKLEAPWHIYKYAKVPPEGGPKLTEFDLFDTAGLQPEGEWSPSIAPIKKKESAYPDIPFLEYHEDEVTWSRKLKVPADAKAGRVAIRCQAGYMICSDQNCSIPGQWTLPDAELTILAAAGANLLKLDRPAAAAPLLVSFVQGEAPRPRDRDTRPASRPKAAKFSAEITPRKAKPGESVMLRVTAKIDHPWHIYKYDPVQPDDGPKLTNFDLFDPAGLVPAGDWDASRPPIRRKDNAFEKLEFLEFYEDEVTWSHALKVPADASAGARAVQVQVTFMICTETNCSQPTRITLPPVDLEVAPGDGPTAFVATPGSATPAAKPSDPSPTPAVAPGTVEPAPAPKEASAPAAASAKVADPTSKPIGEVGKKASEGIVPFLIFCAGGGLFALAMPCVWPMIPVTVNFFVKQGQKNNGSTRGLALAYCLSIILIFMAVGLLFSVSFGAASLSKLANNPWLNFGVAALFLAFGLSLLGLFEIRLPNFLLNASSQGESRGGLIGVMFMALTLTITSFTCTFPVVGGLLVMAAGGDLLYPVIGLATFASVLAFPFFMMALAPGLLAKMPRSGDWMNTVKVVGGLIEIGAAFKFINTAECIYVVPSEAWFNAYTVLSIWVVMALICGIYLLGLFRTDHDYEEIKVGPGRIVSGWAFLSLALFLTPALFGRPPDNKVWYSIAGLLPADASSLRAPVGGGGGGGEALARAATSSEPKQAEREQTSVHGVAWGMSYDGAMERARAEGKPVLIDFTGVNCANCRVMELEVFPRPEVIRALGDFVTVQLYTDVVPIKSIDPEARLKLAEENADREIKVFKEATNPNYAVIDADGNVLGTLGGRVPPDQFVGFLKEALGKYKGSARIAQSGPGA